MQPPSAVVGQEAVAVAREGALARRTAADVEGTLAEQRQIEAASGGAQGSLIVRRVRRDREPARGQCDLGDRLAVAVGRSVGQVVGGQVELRPGRAHRASRPFESVHGPMLGGARFRTVNPVWPARLDP